MMTTVRAPRIMRTILSLMALCLTASLAQAGYGGGTGEPNDPYLIGTPEQMNAVGANPGDWGKHFRLTGDINLAGFDGKAGRPGFNIIARDIDAGQAGFQGQAFTGVFDGDGHIISHLTITGNDYLGLFGLLESGATVRNVGVTDVSIAGSGGPIGALAAENRGSILDSYSEGEVGIRGSDAGSADVGGLVGRNSDKASIAGCYSTCDIRALDRKGENFGGLVGSNRGRVVACYSGGSVSGYESSSKCFGGLVGCNRGTLRGCCSTGSVTNNEDVGGLAGRNEGSVSDCYSIGSVTGGQYVGGLIGYNTGSVAHCYSAGNIIGNDGVGGLVGYGSGSTSDSFWDTDASGLDTSAGGTGKTGADMADIETYKSARWDFAGQRHDGLHEIWQMPVSGGPPVLSFFNGSPPVRLAGAGTVQDPYLICDPCDLGTVLWQDPKASYRLTCDIDLSGINWSAPVVPEFGGIFDGDGHVIDHLTVSSSQGAGLFGTTWSEARVKYLRLEDVDVTGSDCVGGLVGENLGRVKACRVSGRIAGRNSVGGLAGFSTGGILISCTGGSVTGQSFVGGLVGDNQAGEITDCNSTASATGSSDVGGLVGRSTKGDIRTSYSAGLVTGNAGVGGLVGHRIGGGVMACLWDMESSHCTTSDGGVGAIPQQMQTPAIFLEFAWDFIGETDNGTHEIWQMPAGGGRPELGIFGGYTPPALTGKGTAEEPYLVSDGNELGAIVYYDAAASYRLVEDINLADITWSTIAAIPEFSGVFDGNDHTISNLSVDIPDANYVGLFGRLTTGAQIESLRIVNAFVGGTSSTVGILAGLNQGSVVGAHTAGTVAGLDLVGGLIGLNSGRISDSNSTAGVEGRDCVGGLVGQNKDGAVVTSHAAGTATGGRFVGALVGDNTGDITYCYVTVEASAAGDSYVGGFVGDNDYGSITNCCSHASVSGVTTVGGFVGNNCCNGNITKCFSTGKVTGDEGVGGFVGDNSDTVCYEVIQFPFVYTECDHYHGVVTNCFWDIDTSGQTTSDGGTGKKSADMKKEDTYRSAGWNFATAWEIPSRNTYPRLKREPRIIRINDANGLMGLALNPGDRCEYCMLTADIDLSGALLKPIGSFTGVFDGQGHTISNLTIDDPGLSLVGMFTALDLGGVVKNLRLTGVDIQGTSNVGGIVGYSWPATVIDNCHISGTVSGTRDSIGGLVGYNEGRVNACTSFVSVNGNRWVGGLLGMNAGIVSACGSSGDVHGDNDFVGGLVGDNHGEIDASRSAGTVSGDEYVGGLAGRVMDGCTARNCYSSSAVSGVRHIGGLVGRNMGHVGECYAVGLVTGSSHADVGGLVGSRDEANTVLHSFWDTNTSGQTVSSGGTGETGLATGEMWMASTFLDAGWDFVGETANGGDDLWWIDEGRDYPRLWWEVVDDPNAAAGQ